MQNNLSAAAKPRLFPFSSHRNLANNMSQKLRVQLTAEQNMCLLTQSL